MTEFQMRTGLLFSENDNKPLVDKLDELIDFLYEISMRACNQPESRDKFLQNINIDVFYQNAVIIEGLEHYAFHTNSYGASNFFPYKQSLWDKQYQICTTNNFDGHTNTLIVGTSESAVFEAKKSYDKNIETKREKFERGQNENNRAVLTRK